MRKHDITHAVKKEKGMIKEPSSHPRASKSSSTSTPRSVSCRQEDVPTDVEIVLQPPSYRIYTVGKALYLLTNYTIYDEYYIYLLF